MELKLLLATEVPQQTPDNALKLHLEFLGPLSMANVLKAATQVQQTRKEKPHLKFYREIQTASLSYISLKRTLADMHDEPTTRRKLQSHKRKTTITSNGVEYIPESKES